MVMVTATSLMVVAMTIYLYRKKQQTIGWRLYPAHLPDEREDCLVAFRDGSVKRFVFSNNSFRSRKDFKAIGSKANRQVVKYIPVSELSKLPTNK